MMNRKSRSVIIVFLVRLLVILLWCSQVLGQSNSSKFFGVEKLHPAELTDINRSLQNYFDAGNDYSWKLIYSSTDRSGNFHERYQQYFRGFTVDGAQVMVHRFTTRNPAFNGVFTKINTTDGNSQLTESKLKLIATENLQGKFNFTSPEVTNERLVWINTKDSEWQLVYEIIFINPENLEPARLTIDAGSGNILSTTGIACHLDATGTAHTSYQGTQVIHTTQQNGQYTLKCAGKGNGIETYNLNHQLNYNSISTFDDGDNVWELTTNPDVNYATDAHYCAEVFYDFLNLKFSRNSIDNNGMKLISYLNYGTGLSNAFWNGQAVVYGSGNSSTSPMTTLDIAGHEFSHGLIQKTASLNYSNEPGTINEAIADMMGVALEHFATPAGANWLIADQTGNTLRSMQDPKHYFQPEYFNGLYWYYGTGDNGGVHINSGFLNKWFFLCSNGGTGTNEASVTYSVNQIGIEKSIELVYHSLLNYLTPTSGFKEFMYATLSSAIDLYGVCSPEYLSVAEAWRAVGLGSGIQSPVEQLTTGTFSICQGDQITLTADGLPGMEFTWFRDQVIEGSGSVLTVSQGGNYTLTGSICNYQSVDGTASVIVNPLPAVSALTATTCPGTPVIPEVSPSGGVFSIPVPYNGPATTYNYTVTSQEGCTNTAAAQIIVPNVMQAHITNTVNSYPVNSNPVILTSNTEGTFYGNCVTGDKFIPSMLNPGDSTNIYFTYISPQGCSSTDSMVFYGDVPCRKSFASAVIDEQSKDQGLSTITLVLSGIDTEDYSSLSWQVVTGGIITGANNRPSAMFYYLGDEITVNVIFTNKCGEQITIQKTLYIQETNTNPDFILFPNPSSGVFYAGIDNPEVNDFNVKVYDTAGRLIYHTGHQYSVAAINGSDFGKGIYFVEINADNFKSRKKLIIN